METEAQGQEPLPNTDQLGLLGGVVEKPLGVHPPHPCPPAVASPVKPPPMSSHLSSLGCREEAAWPQCQPLRGSGHDETEPTSQGLSPGPRRPSLSRGLFSPAHPKR